YWTIVADSDTPSQKRRLPRRDGRISAIHNYRRWSCAMAVKVLVERRAGPPGWQRTARSAVRATAEISVNRPIEDVWAFLSDVRSMERWVTGVSGARQSADGPLAIGSSVESKYQYAGKTHDLKYVVAALEAASRLTLKATSGPFPLVWSVELRRSGGGTLVRNTVNAGADSFTTGVTFLLLWPLFRLGMKRGIRKDLERLKAALEEAT
ncbi:MAG: SRPBCC family protein, partial [Chloroflexota bacterium]|nr:SRPBCC family protein [Chloroflexota bacterium]